MIRSNTNADEALEVENNHPLRLHVLTQHRQTNINATYQLPNPPTAGIAEDADVVAYSNGREQSTASSVEYHFKICGIVVY